MFSLNHRSELFSVDGSSNACPILSGCHGGGIAFFLIRKTPICLPLPPIRFFALRQPHASPSAKCTQGSGYDSHGEEVFPECQKSHTRRRFDDVGVRFFLKKKLFSEHSRKNFVFFLNPFLRMQHLRMKFNYLF